MEKHDARYGHLGAGAQGDNHIVFQRLVYVVYYFHI